jgi:hypothetical protein
MSVLRGHEDLLPKPIIGFDMGFALVQCGEHVKRYRLTIGASGGIHAEPVQEAQQLPDQLAPADQEEIRARRFADIDQLQ